MELASSTQGDFDTFIIDSGSTCPRYDRCQADQQVSCGQGPQKTQCNLQKMSHSLNR